MKGKITYLFGAGASAKAIPTYLNSASNFSTEFDNFIKKYFENSESHFIVNNVINANLLSNIIKLKNESLHHYTLDTYARKLFLIDSDSSRYKLRLLKCLISCFIDYLQIPQDDNKFIKLDYRYDVLFSTLLERDARFPRLPDNIKFVSWNYDNQIERTLLNFNDTSNDVHEILDHYGFFPCIIGRENINNKIFNHVKLNGHSGQYVIYEDNSFKLKEISSLYQNESEKSFIGRMTASLSVFQKLMIPDIDFLINFAWEKEISNEYSQIAVNNAISIFSKTNILIIIGYSFPSYNYKIDRELLSNLQVGSKIIYQTINTNSKSEEDKILRYLSPWNENEISIKHINSADNFILPHEI